MTTNTSRILVLGATRVGKSTLITAAQTREALNDVLLTRSMLDDGRTPMTAVVNKCQILEVCASSDDASVEKYMCSAQTRALVFVYTNEKTFEIMISRWWSMYERTKMIFDNRLRVVLVAMAVRADAPVVARAHAFAARHDLLVAAVSPEGATAAYNLFEAIEVYVRANE